ncbi:hypothetical protein [Streptomyces inhibens]|uniref:hypothetical protein n=1 Tax=Streptomyces inhibens TaxID=2293571 RepID=UPI000FFB4DE3|nr:hypothetical protein [Streptomyces inhibens]
MPASKLTGTAPHLSRSRRANASRAIHSSRKVARGGIMHDLEVQLRTDQELARAQDLLRLRYAAA